MSSRSAYCLLPRQQHRQSVKLESMRPIIGAGGSGARSFQNFQSGQIRPGSCSSTLVCKANRSHAILLDGWIVYQTLMLLRKCAHRSRERGIDISKSTLAISVNLTFYCVRACWLQDAIPELVTPWGAQASAPPPPAAPQTAPLPVPELLSPYAKQAAPPPPLPPLPPPLPAPPLAGRPVMRAPEGGDNSDAGATEAVPAPDLGALPAPRLLSPHARLPKAPPLEGQPPMPVPELHSPYAKSADPPPSPPPPSPPLPPPPLAGRPAMRAPAGMDGTGAGAGSAAAVPTPDLGALPEPRLLPPHIRAPAPADAMAEAAPPVPVLSSPHIEPPALPPPPPLAGKPAMLERAGAVNVSAYRQNVSRRAFTGDALLRQNLPSPSAEPGAPAVLKLAAPPAPELLTPHAEPAAPPPPLAPPPPPLLAGRPALRPRASTRQPNAARAMPPSELPALPSAAPEPPAGRQRELTRDGAAAASALPSPPPPPAPASRPAARLQERVVQPDAPVAMPATADAAPQLPPPLQPPPPPQPLLMRPPAPAPPRPQAPKLTSEQYHWLRGEAGAKSSPRPGRPGGPRLPGADPNQSLQELLQLPDGEGLPAAENLQVRGRMLQQCLC